MTRWLWDVLGAWHVGHALCAPQRLAWGSAAGRMRAPRPCLPAACARVGDEQKEPRAPQSCRALTLRLALFCEIPACPCGWKHRCVAGGCHTGLWVPHGAAGARLRGAHACTGGHAHARGCARRSPPGLGLQLLPLEEQRGEVLLIILIGF